MEQHVWTAYISSKLSRKKIVLETIMAALTHHIAMRLRITLDPPYCDEGLNDGK